MKNLQAIYSKDYDQNTLKTLALLTVDELNKEEKKYASHYRQLKPRRDLEDYIDQYLSEYYFNSFRQVFHILSANQQLYHRIKISEKRYRNLPCNFDTSEVPELSFKIVRNGKRLSIATFFQLNNESYEAAEVNRFQFLICWNNTYYMLKKSDWKVLEDIAEAGTFDHDTYLEKYNKKLKKYPLDLGGAFREETREASPQALIQISELGGDMLMFLPRWDYDGTIVEDDKDIFTIYEGEKRITYKRDKRAERETLEFLQNAHPNFKGQTIFFLKFNEASKKNWFYNFYHEQLKDNFSVTGMDMLGYFRYSNHKAQSNLSITKTLDNTVAAQFTTYFGAEKIDTKTLQKALSQGDHFVLLKDNSLGILSEEWLKKYALFVKNAKIDKDEIQFAKWLPLISGPEHHQAALSIVFPKNWLEEWNRWNQSEDQLYVKPDSIKAKLRNYQQKGYEWLNLMAEINAGTLLADDMGLGKTLQSISAMAYWLKSNPESKFLIVSPASLIYNWKNEFEKFAPDFNLFIYHGAQRDIHDFLKGDNQVLITSYALIRNDNELFSNMLWEAIVLDEGHHIKNYTSQQTQAVLKLNGKRRIILNGTPIMNNITDLFPQLHFLLPQLFPSQKHFKEQFEKPLQHKKIEGQMDALKKMTSPFMLRRTKETAAPDLPQKTESVLWCEMEDEQRSAYEDIKSHVRNNIMIQIKDKGLNKAKLGVLQGITKLRQVCSSPRLLKKESDFSSKPSIKIDNLIETLTSDLANHKVLVFSQFLGTMDLLSEAFEKNEITFRRFSGKTTAKERIRLVSEFQEKDSDIQVFLLSLMAGNSGINLTNANYVFLMEPWWNKAVQQQAIDRTHRIGQDQKVFAYNMICKDTIEEKIMALQERKQILSDEVIADDGNFVKNLTADDIAFLFE
ncbi:DEAD/DEAH box helicase [Cryomorpha ignava]|uniref:DEAD/DEAH box helicase n=1 Tax=Cryomorpha ignava TaxID=101383 RepID=A0A7K3WP17_9FLAO|nr:DEAD/DEAH box helicase [Cryomorpha ignava]NEN23268.1 DEAD/DEAH box helicase [Cryomorpha ignava]